MKLEKIERKIYGVGLETRSENESEIRVLRGESILFDSLSEPIYGFFKERVLAGALDKTLREDDQVCLWNHDTKYVLGRKSAGSLIFRITPSALYFEVTPPNTAWANDLVVSIDRRDISQMSFGFFINEERWLEDKKTISEHGFPIREILDLTLLEISVVTFPAYTETNVRGKEYIPRPPIKDNYQDEARLRKLDILRLQNKG